MIRFLILLLFAPTAVWGIGLGPTCPAVHAVAGFMPTQVGDLVLWVDANRLCLPAGAAVDSWKDFSPIANSPLASPVASQKPILSNANGRPALKFDGTNDYLTTGSIALHTRMSMYMVVKDGSSRLLIEHSVNTLLNDGVALSGGIGPWSVRRTVARSANGTDGWIGTNWCLISFSYDPATTNGVTKKNTVAQSIPSYSSSGVPASSTLSDSLYLFSRAGTSDFGNGGIAELIIVTNVLSTTIEQSLTRHLGVKYGIVIP